MRRVTITILLLFNLFNFAVIDEARSDDQCYIDNKEIRSKHPAKQHGNAYINFISGFSFLDSVKMNIDNENTPTLTASLSNPSTIGLTSPVSMSGQQPVLSQISNNNSNTYDYETGYIFGVGIGYKIAQNPVFFELEAIAINADAAQNKDNKIFSDITLQSTNFNFSDSSPPSPTPPAAPLPGAVYGPLTGFRKSDNYKVDNSSGLESKNILFNILYDKKLVEQNKIVQYSAYLGAGIGYAYNTSLNSKVSSFATQIRVGLRISPNEDLSFLMGYRGIKHFNYNFKDIEFKINGAAKTREDVGTFGGEIDVTYPDVLIVEQIKHSHNIHIMEASLSYNL